MFQALKSSLSIINFSLRRLLQSLKMAQPPDLKIPHSSSIVKVRIIDTTSTVSNMPLGPFISPITPGFTHLTCPSYAFLIEHPTQKILFDLGIRQDWENMSPIIIGMSKQYHVGISVEKGVRQILEENDVKGESISAIIWSHYHYDHTGDPSTFESHTKLVVGPGFKEAFVPGYPEKPDCQVLTSDYTGRDLVEIAFDESLKIGRFKAHDYFGDGSFYLLDAPGHAIGHMCGLARTASNPDTFVLMGGDVCHHAGELRPNIYHPLPTCISPHPLKPSSASPCPGDIFAYLLRDGDATKPFYEIARTPEGASVMLDADEAERTVTKVQEADAEDRLLVVMAHDESLKDFVQFFPEYLVDVVERDVKVKSRWAFLKDFQGAVEG